ncbi:MAG: hypothetical protein ACRD0K_30990 [Egibacteraceae bacterium]
MKLGNPARLRVAAALCAGGLMATVPVASAAAIHSPPEPACDPQPRRIVTIVDGFLSRDGQDCRNIDTGPPPSERNSDESGAEGGNARVTGSENSEHDAVIPEEPVADAPAAEAQVADAPAAEAPAAEAPAEESAGG